MYELYVSFEELIQLRFLVRNRIFQIKTWCSGNLVTENQFKDEVKELKKLEKRIIKTMEERCLE